MLKRVYRVKLLNR